MTNPGDDDRQKQAMKEAYKEWLNEQFAEFGKFAAKSMIAALFAALAYLWMKTTGYAK